VVLQACGRLSGGEGGKVGDCLVHMWWWMGGGVSGGGGVCKNGASDGVSDGASDDGGGGGWTGGGGATSHRDPWRECQVVILWLSKLVRVCRANPRQKGTGLQTGECATVAFAKKGVPVCRRISGNLGV
jgi:hypothetical protein